MKKVLSIALALLLVFSLTLTAFAVEADQKIVINHNHAGHSYEAYQIFTGTFNDQGVLSDIEWGDGVKNTEDLAADVATAFGVQATDCDTAGKIAKLLSGEKATHDSEEALKFAKVLAKKDGGSLKYLSDVKENAVWSESDGTYTFSELLPGYYLIKDQEGTMTGESEAATFFILRVTHGTTPVNPKAGVPSVTKKVDDTNDSGLEVDHIQMDSADHDIGDLVHFTITATLPTEGIEYYENYQLKFYDEMCEALELQKDTVKVELVGEEKNTDVTSYFTTSDPTFLTGNSGDRFFTVSCANVKAIDGVTNQSRLILSYDAKLTENGVVYGNPGNPNKVQLQYSNNPNYSGEGDPVNGKTPFDEVAVFTYYLNVNKTAGGSGLPLAGADFKLEKWDKTIQETNKYVEVEFPNGDGKEYGYTFTKGSDSYDVRMDSDGKIISVTKVGETTALEDAAIEALGLPTNGIADATSFYFKGLDAGKYRLTETKTPSGFNTLLDPIEFEIVANHQLNADQPKLTELKSNDTDFSGSVQTGAVTTSIMNTQGSILPSTGGMGTTLLYVFGSIMVLGAAVLLVAKKRMSNKG